MARLCKYHIRELENKTFCPHCMRNLRENEILELNTSYSSNNSENTAQPTNTQRPYTSSSNNTVSINSNSAQPTSSQNQGAKKPGCLFWIVIILLVGGLLNMCDGRSEEEKWEDSYKGVFEEYAEFYGWFPD